MLKLIYLYYKERNSLIYGTTKTLVDRFWQGRTNFGNQNRTIFAAKIGPPRTNFRGDQFFCDDQLQQVPQNKVLRHHSKPMNHAVRIMSN